MVNKQVVLANARVLEGELGWFSELVRQRLRHHFEPAEEPLSVDEIPPPALPDSGSSYAGLLQHYGFSYSERLAVVLALVPHLRPQLLEPLTARPKGGTRPYAEFGVVLGEGVVEPTGETLAFLLGGNDLGWRFGIQGLFGRDHVFARHDLLRLDGSRAEAATLKDPLRISPEVLSLLTTGTASRPDFGSKFPARLLETELTWEDLILHPHTRDQVSEIEAWIEHGPTLLGEWGMAPKLRPGHRALFHGPPGTGKTMTACLLGKSTGREVYKVDLSLVISKYIGETEKNLARVFRQAEHRGWILFFDEADSLFGRRTETKDSHDRYANQEVSYLLQRVETFDGIVILASNLRQNMDDAFARRFETVVHFPLPRQEERQQLWTRGFSPKASFDPTVDLGELAREHPLSGGSIMNVVRFASLRALREDSRPITQDDLLRGIREERAKEGRTT